MTKTTCDQKNDKQRNNWFRPSNHNPHNNYRRSDPHDKPVANISKNPPKVEV